ncbi:MAG: MFS transporter [Bryobacteraceae bacterium]|nr:MFS transporter [Bryobacteraceae bacterium]
MHPAANDKQSFYGWWMTLFAFFTFGIAVGIPYYGGPFFYDYYMREFGWSRPDVTLGFPLAATLTLWVGPLLVHRFSPRKMILVGTGFTAVAFIGFGTMKGSLPMYYTFWFLYVVGYIFSGPIAHQVIVSNWFRSNRGKAMALVYLGVGVFGGISAKLIAQPLTKAFGFQYALIAIGCMMFLAWPLTLFFTKDRPSDLDQFPDGAAAPADEVKAPPAPFMTLLRSPAFWLLVIGSFCSIGSIGSINQHMKLVFKEQGFTGQQALDDMFSNATLCILFSSIGGRLFMGWLADKYSKKLVMTATYVLVAGTIPLLALVRPESPSMVYVFAILFGFGMGADYMLIPLMAAEQFGVNSLARAMAIILPTDTIGQTWFPYLVSMLHEKFGSYGTPLQIVFVLSFIGAVAVGMLPRAKKPNAIPPGVDARNVVTH